jgi:hypothetical protein
MLIRVERLAALPAVKEPDLGAAEDVLEMENEIAAAPGE